MSKWSEGYRVKGVYRDEKHGSTSFQVVGGEKRYLRRWDSGEREWSWTLNEDALEVWTGDGYMMVDPDNKPVRHP